MVESYKVYYMGNPEIYEPDFIFSPRLIQEKKMQLLKKKYCIVYNTVYYSSKAPFLFLCKSLFV